MGKHGFFVSKKKQTEKIIKKLILKGTYENQFVLEGINEK